MENETIVSPNNIPEPDPNQEQKQIDHSPNNPPWGIVAAILLLLASVALIVALPNIFLLPYFLIKGIKVTEGQDPQQILLGDPTAVMIAIGATLIAHVITIIIAWFVVTKLQKHSFTKMLGWKSGGFKLWHGAVILVAIYAFALGMVNLLGSYENDMLKLLKSSRTAVYMVAILATFSAPLVEEVVYRGVLYSAFQRALGVGASVALVTIIFAAVHVPQYYPDAATIISILVLSLVITLIRVKTDNLLPCIIFHFVFNGLQSILLILQPYLPKAIDPLEVETALFWLLR